MMTCSRLFDIKTLPSPNIVVQLLLYFLVVDNVAVNVILELPTLKLLQSAIDRDNYAL